MSIYFPKDYHSWQRDILSKEKALSGSENQAVRQITISALSKIEASIKKGKENPPLGKRITWKPAFKPGSHRKDLLTIQELEDIGKKAFNPDTSKQWNFFIASLSPSQRKTLVSSLNNFKEFDLDEVLINVIFLRLAHDMVQEPSKLLDELLRQSKEAAFLWALEKMRLLKGIDNLKDQWRFPPVLHSNSKLFSESLKALGLIGEDRKKSPPFVQLYSHASPAGKYILMHFAMQAAEFCEASIECLIDSGLFSSELEKGRFLAEFLLPYKAMMDHLMILLRKEDQKRLMADDAHSEVSFQTYKDGLEEGMAYLNTQDMLVSGTEDYKKYEVWRSDAPPQTIQPYGTLTDYFHSKGLKEICKDFADLSISESQAKNEFQVRDYFNLDSFIPGSNVDRSNKIHWPSRLIEYYLVINRTVAKIVKHELTRTGLKVSDLPKNLVVFCQELEKNFPGLTAASIVRTSTGLEVVYDIPLRQHAAQVSFLFPLVDKSPVVMNIKAMAGDEGDRWKRTAVIASLMSHHLGLKFFHNEPPAINYNHTDRVSFSLTIPQNYEKLALFMKKIRVMIYDNTMVSDSADDGTTRSGPARFEELVVRGGTRVGYKKASVTQFGELFNIKSLDDWRGVPEEFFADSFYLNLYLLDYFTLKGDVEMVEKIVTSSIKGLARYGLDDYTGKGITPETERYYSAFSGHRTSSLVEGIEAALIHLQNKATLTEVIGKISFLHKLVDAHKNRILLSDFLPNR